ncbi:MAG: hypothetical protein ACK4IY_06060, partial [Chitinophagales bacterium]
AKAHIGDIEGELADWEQSTTIDNTFAQAYADKAIAKLTLRNYEAAINDAQKAIALDSRLAELLTPVIENIENEMAVRENEIRKESNPEVIEEVKNWGNNRRDFLKQITLVGMATMTGSLLSSCGTDKLAGGM